jgi:bleomycin hydrolase
MKSAKKSIGPVLCLLLVPVFVQPQGKKIKPDPYEFTILKEVKTTPVKNQYKTGTCWSFATTSFVESELIRIGKGEHILSPMWNVRFIYPLKAENYVRYSGSADFEPGGQAHDVINVIKVNGFIPEEVYNGMNIGEAEHNHGEMDAVLKAVADAVIKNKGGKITPRWKEVFESVLNIYLGVPPKEFVYKGKSYTPKSFADSLDFKPADYIEITSYTHHPFYTKFDLEIPANFSKDQFYNLPVDEFMKVINNAIETGFSVEWNGDISEKSFDKKKSIATIPADEESIEPSRDESGDPEDNLIKEKTVTQEMRQQTFDNKTTTDDHNMLITGIAADQKGNKFYYTKNSWGAKDKKYGGYWYLSEAYLRLKTLSIMVHKNALPADIKMKLGIRD